MRYFSTTGSRLGTNRSAEKRTQPSSELVMIMTYCVDNDNDSDNSGGSDDDDEGNKRRKQTKGTNEGNKRRTRQNKPKPKRDGQSINQSKKKVGGVEEVV